MSVKDLLRKTPFIQIYRNYKLNKKREYENSLTDEEFVSEKFLKVFGREIDLKNPVTYNEKLQWLKLYDHKPIYNTIVDKCEVKKYIADKIGEEYIIPTLGVWERFDDIDFDALPDKFVLKCTHDSGGLVICQNKAELDKKAAKKKIEESLKRNFYFQSREWPYKNVKPRIIAEEYMEDSTTKELRDYKFFCFDGEVKALFIATERQKQGEDVKFDFFDTDFKHLPFKQGHENAEIPPEKPQCFDKMLKLSAELSKGFPQIRVDFYEVDGKIYFGEYTFYHFGGFMPFEPNEWDYTFGSWIKLPKKLKNENMKILQINAVYNLSSTGRITTELHEKLLSNGIDSYVAYAMTDKPDDEGLYKIGSAFDRKCHALLSRAFGKQAYFSKRATKQLIGYIDSIKPDIVHLGNLHSNYINLPQLLEYIVKNDIATVVTLHDFWFLTGKCFYFTAFGCSKWQTHCENCPNLNSANPTWCLDRSKEMFADKLKYFLQIKRLAFVGVSEWAAKEASKSPMAQDAVVKRIYNWIDFSKFHKKDASYLRKKLQLENDFVILGVAAIWDERKGIKSFVELAKRMNGKAKIILVGNCPENIRFPENVIMTGATNSVEELSDYYNLADVFVTLSLEETFGMVSAEALSCGTPVVCYDSTANPELVGDGCGYAVKKNSIEEVVQCIEKIMKNKKEYYSDKCIEYAHLNFNKTDRIKDYISLYEELISDKR